LLLEDYAGQVRSAPVFSRLHLDGVHAVVVDHAVARVGLIRGTDEGSDWWRYNLRLWPCPREGDSGRLWHSGFLKHAEVVYAFFRDKGVRQIAGHSLGAAAAQIVGVSLGVPTVAFAAPKVLYAAEQPTAWRRLVVCHNHRGDPVCHQPRSWTGPVFWRLARHVGTVEWLPGTGHALRSFGG